MDYNPVQGEYSNGPNCLMLNRLKILYVYRFEFNIYLFLFAAF